MADGIAKGSKNASICIVWQQKETAVKHHLAGENKLQAGNGCEWGWGWAWEGECKRANMSFLLAKLDVTVH